MRYHFTSQAQLALSNAKKIAKSCQNSYIGTEHLLLGILDVENAKLKRLLLEYHVTYQSLYEEVVSLFGFSKEADGRMEYTCTMDEILQQCLIVAYQNQMKMVDLDCLSLCLLQAENNVANELLRRNGIVIEEVIESLKGDQLAVLNKFKELRNLNEVQRKNPTQIVQREVELKIMIDTLCRRMKANPLLIGEAGVGKSALVEELARRIVNHEVPKELRDCVVVELSLNNLVAGTKYRGEFEEKIQKLLETIMRYPQVILFIDEIHMMIHAGKAEGSIDVAGVMKPYLARGDLRCIGATTIDEYNACIEKDRALKRRFQVIKIEEPSMEDVKEMLLCKKLEYEKHHHVEFPAELIEPCLELSSRYLPHLTFPDKAIDVLDLSCVKAKMSNQLKVDLDCLKKTIESLSQIPFSFGLKVKEHCATLENCVGKQATDEIMQRLDWIDQKSISKGPRDVWLLGGDELLVKRQLAEELARIYLNQEKALTVLDGPLVSANNLLYLSQCLKKNPFLIVYLENFDQMSHEMIHLFQTVFQQGTLQVQEMTLDFSFSLILVDTHQKKHRSVGFVQAQEKGENQLFTLDLNQAGKLV